MDIKFLYENTELTIQQIATKLNIPFGRVFKYIKKNYSSVYRKDRKAICYRNSKVGSKNPMYGIVLDKHHNYIGVISDNKGYVMMLKPSWYTGRKSSKHVFVHSLVVCEYMSLTEVPKGWVVHHCDFNPLNNSFDNLVLMKAADHTKLHNYLNGVTTISKESTLKWVETYGTQFKREDIVYSNGKPLAACYDAGKEITSFTE